MSYLEQINKENIPSHVAIIMDGNGRWAKNKGLDRFEGHNQGARTLKQIVNASIEAGVKYLTVYAFSVENWKRPQKEVEALMNLLIESITQEFYSLAKQNIRLNMIGDTSMMPQNVLEELNKAILSSQNNTGLCFTVALSYGSRLEIVNAAKELLKEYKENPFDIDSITPEKFASKLYTKDLPDPELLIRTSGEIRISNFLLWQISYSELYFTDVLWPDFSKEDFFKAIVDYQQRERRFGKTSDQIKK